MNIFRRSRLHEIGSRHRCCGIGNRVSGEGDVDVAFICFRVGVGWITMRLIGYSEGLYEEVGEKDEGD